MNGRLADRHHGWLVVVGQFFKKLVARVGCVQAVAQRAKYPSEEPVKASPERFKPQALLGRRVAGSTQRKLLEILVAKPWATRRELDEYLGVQNSPDVVMRMVRKSGWQIHKIDCWMRAAADTRKRRYHYYMLSSNDIGIARSMLEMPAGTSPPISVAVT